jgi:prevent-host-death family protein
MAARISSPSGDRGVVPARSRRRARAVDSMTRNDYHETMKTVRIAELKARLSEHLREVKRGNTLIVMERDTPIARVIPYAADSRGLKVSAPLGRYPSLREVPLPPPLDLGVDAVDILLDQRQIQR